MKIDNNSLNKVLWIVGCVLTVSSILAPLILNWMQKRRYKLDKKELKNHIEDKMKSLETKLDKKIEEKLMEEKENIEKQNELKLLELEGDFHESLAQNYKFMDDTVIKNTIGETINIGFSEFCVSAIRYTEANNIEKSHDMIKKLLIFQKMNHRG